MWPGQPTSLGVEDQPPEAAGLGGCSRESLPPIALPTRPEAWGLTDSGPGSWLGPQLLLSSVCGPSGQSGSRRKRRPARALQEE